MEFSSQEAGRVCLHQKLQIELKTKGFIGPLSSLDRGNPKCVVFASYFGFSRTVKPYKSLERSMYTSILTLTNEH